MTQYHNTPQDRAYLGVQHSANGKIWQSSLSKRDENTALQISQIHGLDEIISQVLVARGIDANTAENFLTPTLRYLMPEPYTIRDMDKGAQRLARACLAGEKVALFGDYDVDGASSTAIMVRFLKKMGIQTRVYIPDRQTEGYGPNEKALRFLIEEGASFLITVDCGATSEAVYKIAAEKSVDILVLDHHQAQILTKEQEASRVIQVNPNRQDDASDLGILCAAGVVFMCLVATARILRQKNTPNIPNLLQYLDLVALATVCDIVPLQGLNRAFVKQGLILAEQQHNLGLKALIKATKITAPLNAYHFGFILGPRINAAGRIGDSSLGSKLLSCDNENEATRIAQQLDSLNYSRQAIEKEQLNEALYQVESAQLATNNNKMVFACGHWHVGIVGLLAARLKERLNLPAFIMTKQTEGDITGSARSIPSLDVGRLIHQAVEEKILSKGGGHTQAAGFSLKAENIALFQDWLTKQLSNNNTDDEIPNFLAIDSSISASGASVELISTLEKAGPYGAGHPQPVFALPNHTITHIKEVGKDGDHLSLSLKDSQGKTLSAMAFRTKNTELGQFLQAHLRKNVHFAGTLSLNHWNGRVVPQFRIIDAAEVK